MVKTAMDVTISVIVKYMAKASETFPFVNDACS